MSIPAALREASTAAAPATAAAAPAQAAPAHVAIIMDGNRRWARSRGMPPVYGHRRGADAVRRAVEACGREGVRYLTLFAFSSENWRRPAGEIGDLMNLLRIYLRREIDELARNDIRLRVIGDRTGLATDIRDMIAGAEERTRDNRRLNVVIALNYGSRAEITDAVQAIAAKVAAGELAPRDITEATIAQHLYTAQMPDPDLLIRTAGEMRVSNYLLWQISYAELYVSHVLWPDYTAADLHQAIAAFAKRNRRFGALDHTNTLRPV